LIKPEDAMEYLVEVRKHTATHEDLPNDKLTSKYNQRVNDRIKKYLKKAEIPITSETQGSHSLRKLYVAYTFHTRPNKKETENHFIQRVLGHSKSGSQINYDAINIVSDTVLDADSKMLVNDIKIQANENMEKIENIDEIIEKKVEAILENKKPEIRPFMTKADKYAKIEELVSQGKAGFRDMQRAGISNYTYNQYKKEKKDKAKPKPVSKPAPVKKPEEKKEEIKDVRRGSRVRIKKVIKDL